MNNTPRGRALLLASNNAHKREELARILAGHELVVPRDLGMDFDYEEGSESFHENALGKALRLFALAGGRSGIRGVIADDSGLCVDALGGRPGVHSNRYGSEGGHLLSAGAKNGLLLRELGETPDRGASFVCALAFVLEVDRFFVFQEVLRGRIAHAPSGTGGFGYDPIFLVPEPATSVAELAPERKDAISHRGRAARRLRALLAALDQDETGRG
jgi:XTP/dITP diphosphohydrolase